MAQQVIQTAFSSGEFAPNLLARVDLDKYHTGAGLLTNFFVDYHGGALNRAGTEWCGGWPFVGGTTFIEGNYVVASRLVPFIYSQTVAYMLEFGYVGISDGFMRVLYNGAYVTDSTKNITGVSKANPGVVTSNAHGFVAGESVYITGVVGMTELNGKTFVVGATTANTFALKNGMGQDLNTLAYTAYVSGGTASRILVVPTQFGDSVNTLRFVQSADVVTITNTDGTSGIYEVRRVSASSFTVTLMTSGTAQAAPTGVTLTVAGAGTTGFAYAVTAVGVNGDESIAAAGAGAASNAGIPITAAVSNHIAWTAAAGAVYYNIYRFPWWTNAIAIPSSLYGLIGSTKGVAFRDNNLVADYSQTPALANTDPFQSASANYNPWVASYFQQRRVFGGGLLTPQTLNISQSGLGSNFNQSVPIRDTDAITVSLASLQVNAIQGLVPMPGGLVVLTTGGAWQVSGDGPTAPITPDSIIGIPQGYDGATSLPAIVINNDILFQQQLGSAVRGLAFNFGSNIYESTELSIISSHFFVGYTLVDWCYAAEPWRTVWAVRDDGTLLSLAYHKEQNVIGWASHTTDGTFKSVASIPENGESTVYCIVNRSFGSNGSYDVVERFASRVLADGIDDAWFVDFGLRYDSTAATVISGLDHLEGQEVAILADGGVVPNQTVYQGTITLATAASNVLVGLPIPSAKLQSLRLDLGNPTTQAKRKKLNALTVRVAQTRGIKIGSSFDSMKELKQRAHEAYGDPIELKAVDDLRGILAPEWEETGQVCIQQDYPLPAQVLGIIPEVWIGDN